MGGGPGGRSTRPTEERRADARPVPQRFSAALVVGLLLVASCASDGEETGRPSTASTASTASTSSTVASTLDGSTVDADGPGWTQYGHDLANSRLDTDPSAVTADSVGDLVPGWSLDGVVGVTGTPTVSDGVAYFGDWAGTVHAVDPATGDEQWARDLGGSVIGFDSWEIHRLGDVTITAVPALHGPPGSEPWVGKVTGFVLEAPGEPTVYVSGDNASLALVEQIANRFPEIDIAVLFAGAATVPRIPSRLTLSAADARQAAELLGASRVVGLHTEDWEHFAEDAAQFAAAFEGSGLLVPTPRGETVTLAG